VRDQLKTAMKNALKDGDTKRLGTIRLITAALKDRDIAARSKGQMDGISDEEILSMLQTMIKQRKESARMYREGGREELAAGEDAEITVICGFMPEQMDDEAVSKAIQTAIAETGAESIKDMGKVMGFLKQSYAGQMDFAAASAKIKSTLMGD
jgi:uncharacterized protein YqeY